jgi:hypothetical protein
MRRKTLAAAAAQAAGAVVGVVEDGVEVLLVAGLGEVGARRRRCLHPSEVSLHPR